MTCARARTTLAKLQPGAVCPPGVLARAQMTPLFGHFRCDGCGAGLDPGQRHWTLTGVTASAARFPAVLCLVCCPDPSSWCSHGRIMDAVRAAMPRAVDAFNVSIGPTDDGGDDDGGGDDEIFEMDDLDE